MCGTGGTAALIYNLELDGSCQLHAPAAVTHGKGPWYPLYRRLVGPKQRSDEQISASATNRRAFPCEML